MSFFRLWDVEGYMGEMTGEMTDMERILGILGGAELVEVYKTLEKCTNTHHGSPPL